MAARSRYVATILLVLIALGGAGLAVAADRQQDAHGRPEVTWAADNAAKPWLASATTDLSALSGHAADLAKAGRQTLGSVQGLNFDAMRTAIEDGDAATNVVAADLQELTDDQRVARQTIDRWRLGPTTSAQFDAFDTAVTSATNMPAAWLRVKTRATNVYGLIDDLQRHDGLVFRGTTAGTQGNWADAISTLAEAGTALDAARGMRDDLGAGAGATVDTLEQLIARYAAYDSALSALYEYLGSGGAESDDAFKTLTKAVDSAQRALPGDNSVFSLIVGEAAGIEITEALVQLEQARGDINHALDASAAGEAQ
jgi:hypothetical protein